VPTRHEIPVTGDGTETVVAVHHEAPADPEGWLVCCHGFLSDKHGSYEGRCERAVEEGYHGVRFDFRGCGESDGSFAESTLTSRIEDLNAVLDYFDSDSPVLFGSSFGGAVAFHAAGDDRIEAVATRAPVTYGARAFEDARETVERTGECQFGADRWIDERFFEDFERYSFGDVTATLDVPVAIFHGTADGSVAVEGSFEAAAELDGDVLVQTFDGEGHRFSRDAERRLREQLFDWLAVV